MKKKICVLLSAVLAVSLCFGVLAGCGNKRNKNELNVFMFAQSHEQTIYKAVVNRFNQANSAESGITVKITFGADDYFTKLTTQLASGVEADVYYVQPGDVRMRVNFGQLVNLDNYVDQTKLSDIYPEALNFFKYNGNVNGEGSLYALPKDYSQYVLGLNTDLTAAAQGTINRYVWNWTTGKPQNNSEPYNYVSDGNGGFTKTSVRPSGYDDWSGIPYTIKNTDGTSGDTVLVKLPGLPGKTITVGGETCNVVYTFDEYGAVCNMCCDYSNNLYATAFWEEMCMMSFIWGAGGEFLSDNNTKVALNSDAAMAGQQGYYDLLHKWNAQQLGSTDNTGYQLFPQGKLVFYPVGTWDIGYFADSDINFDVMPWPIGNQYAGTSIADRQNLWKARADSVGYGVSANCINPEYAVKFIEYLTLDPDIQQYLVESGAQIPNNMSLREKYLNNEYKFRKPGESETTDMNLAPANKQLLIDVATGANGKYGPTVYTYTADWWDEYRSKLTDIPGTGFTFSGATTVTLKDDKGADKQVTMYENVMNIFKSATTAAQGKLNDAIEQEKEQKM